MHFCFPIVIFAFHQYICITICMAGLRGHDRIIDGYAPTYVMGLYHRYGWWFDNRQSLCVLDTTAAQIKHTTLPYDETQTENYIIYVYLRQLVTTFWSRRHTLSLTSEIPVGWIVIWHVQTFITANIRYMIAWLISFETN